MKFSCLCVFTLVLTVLAVTVHSEDKTLPLVFCCRQDNDLYSLIHSSKSNCQRFSTPTEALNEAEPGSAVLILADDYPKGTTQIDGAVFRIAEDKKLKVFVEYPSQVPGLTLGDPVHTVWERTVVASDGFGDSLPKLSILSVNDCTYLPVKAPDPLLVIARVAGYDKAVYGLPDNSFPLLFEIKDQNIIVATTRLSSFITGRYAPTGAWEAVWNSILERLVPGKNIRISYDPAVHPAYGPKEPLPSDAERRALHDAAGWYRRSRLLIHPSEKEEIYKLLKSGAEIRETPDAGAPSGDGSEGILEGYASPVEFDGTQFQRLPIRADCCAEVAMALAVESAAGKDSWSRKTGKNLLDFVYFKSGMCKGDRGNPEHPAFGLIAWGDVAPAWVIANYGDDNARVMLATMAAAGCLKSDKWDVPLLRGLLANLRTTGTLGFRGDRIDMFPISEKGWRAYHDSPTVNYAPHFESYLWACNIWAYHHTHYKPFLERTKTAIRMTMEAYPDGWRWRDSIERARMLLCLSWLVRVENTPEHLKWLDTVSRDLLKVQQPCGALEERVNEAGGAGHYFAPRSNEAYGTGETPLIQENGDPASDQLYTTGFALLGLHEAVAATNDPALKKAEDRLTEYLCRIQVRSKHHPNLDGAWFRAFDYGRWEYWASSGDAGWGAWSIESGWGTAWIASVLGFRQMNTSLWDITSESRIADVFSQVHKEMMMNQD